jgi:hypothetical protein
LNPLPPPVPSRIQFDSVLPGQSVSTGGGGLPKASGQCSAKIDSDADGVFFVDGLETLEFVQDPDAPRGSKGVWEILDRANGSGPIDIEPGLALEVFVRFACPTSPRNGPYTASAVVLDGQQNQVLRVPITATIAPETLGIAATQTAPTFFPGQIESFEFQFESTFRQDVRGFFGFTGPTPPFSYPFPESFFPSVPAMGSTTVKVSLVCSTEAAAGKYTLVFSYNQTDGPPLSITLPYEVEVVILGPPPDPRRDHFDALWVEKSTQRICQLTGGGDPEGKPHPNDTTRFGLLGTDLGSSFDHFESGEHRTYFFFGDTNTSAGDPFGDSIAYTTDDTPEPQGLHLQFIMGDNQWRRLVIPGISLGKYEVPTGGFSHAGRIFVFATTGILEQGDQAFMENSVLASTTDAHNNFDLSYFVSHRDDNVDTPSTGGKFINVAPVVINNDDWPGLPDNAQPGGQGLLIAGNGCYRKSAPYLAYAPLPDGQSPALSDWRYLQGFHFWEPGYGPNGPPNWSTAENDAAPMFDASMGEMSYCFNAGLKRWLILYGGCTPAGCGILLHSAPMPWGPWSEPQLIFDSNREGAQGKYMFECGPYGAYVISRYDQWDPAAQQTTFYYTLSNGNCISDPTEPRYQVHLMKSSLRLVSI